MLNINSPQQTQELSRQSCQPYVYYQLTNESKVGSIIVILEMFWFQPTIQYGSMEKYLCTIREN